MVGHRRVAVLAAALLIAFMVPAMAPSGAVRAASGSVTQAGAGNGTIYGTIVDRNSIPVAGAAVNASGSGLSVSTTVGSNGFYKLVDMPSGSYILSVTPLPGSGLAAGWYSTVSAGNFTTNAWSATPVVITTTDAEASMVVSPGWLPPPPPPPPTFGSISGTVVGAGGGSVAGGTVQACTIPGWFCTPATIAGNGSYWIGSLAAGTYAVSITPPTSAFVPGYYLLGATGNFTTSSSLATQVTVVNANVPLPLITVSAGVVPGFGSISGTVVGTYSGSLAGGTVQACTTPGWFCTSATIGWDGSYWIGTLPSANYIVSITPPTSSYVAGYYAQWATGNFTTSASSATVVTVWNSNVPLPLITVPGYYPTGGSISGTVVGTYSGSVAGGTVQACTTPGWFCRSATIGWDGSYWIGTLTSGSYIVSITPPISSYVAGYYAQWATGNFTTSASSATAVSVWNTNVALPTITVPGYTPTPTYGSLSGYVVGAAAGSLSGGSVTACTTSLVCVSTTIGSNGAYAFTSLPLTSYTLMVTPLSGSGYPSGFYAAGLTGNFTTASTSATRVNVATNVTVPTITVPLSQGGIVVVTPQAYVVWAYLRPEFSTGTSTSLRVPEGSRAELASMIDPKLAGMRVEVWRRLAGQGWVMITTRGISGQGWVIYRFTATAGVGGAQFRFRLPASPLTLSVWSVARTVRLS